MYIHKECARDSPVDHTATYYFGKVLMAENYGIIVKIEVPFMWDFFI